MSRLAKKELLMRCSHPRDDLSIASGRRDGCEDIIKSESFIRSLVDLCDKNNKDTIQTVFSRAAVDSLSQACGAERKR